MDKKEIESRKEKIKEYFDWMKESTDCHWTTHPLDDLRKDCGDYEEILLTVSLSNGEKIELSNHVDKCYFAPDVKRKLHFCDYYEAQEYGVEFHYLNKDGIYNSTYVPFSSIVALTAKANTEIWEDRELKIKYIEHINGRQ
jgi:hypothetical protein